MICKNSKNGKPKIYKKNTFLYLQRWPLGIHFLLLVPRLKVFVPIFFRLHPFRLKIEFAIFDNRVYIRLSLLKCIALAPAIPGRVVELVVGETLRISIDIGVEPLVPRLICAFGILS